MATASSSRKTVRNSFSPNLFQLRTLEENSRTAKRMRRRENPWFETRTDWTMGAPALRLRTDRDRMCKPESAAVETEEPSGSEWETNGRIPDCRPCRTQRRAPGTRTRWRNHYPIRRRGGAGRHRGTLGGPTSSVERIWRGDVILGCRRTIEEEGDSTAPEADGKPRRSEGDVENGTDEWDGHPGCLGRRPSRKRIRATRNRVGTSPCGRTRPHVRHNRLRSPWDPQTPHRAGVRLYSRHDLQGKLPGYQ